MFTITTTTKLENSKKIDATEMQMILNSAIRLRRTVQIQLFNLDLGCDDDIY
jgi:hypothetical protein